MQMVASCYLGVYYRLQNLLRLSVYSCLIYYMCKTAVSSMSTPLGLCYVTCLWLMPDVSVFILVWQTTFSTCAL